MVQKLSKREETHKRMLAAAGRSFRHNGYAGIGVDGIAKEAGVTSGAFYAHFGSKDGAFSAAVLDGLDEVVAGIPAFQQKNGANWIEAFARYYLGADNRDNRACGCAMSSLTSEVVRSDQELRVLFESKMRKITALVAKGLADGTEQEKVARAWSMLGVLIGGVNLARAMHSPELKEMISQNIIASAVQVAGKTVS